MNRFWSQLAMRNNWGSNRPVAEHAEDSGSRWGLAFGLILCFGYAIQIVSPLRINADVVTLLDLTARLTDGKPFLTNGARPVFPIGVPFLFSTMERMGVANAAGFAVANLFFLAVAAMSARAISRSLRLSQTATRLVLLISFSSFVLFKHSVLPLSDIPFMAVSLASLALMEMLGRYHGARRIGTAVIALLLVAACILVRRVGVALVPAAGFAIWSSLGSAILPRGSVKRFIFVAAIVSIVGLLALLLVRQLIYAPDFHFANPRDLLKARTLDLGELLLNIPANKMGRFYVLDYAAGAMLLGLMFLGFCNNLSAFRTTHLYLLTYIAIIFVWPYGDSRFWIPVLPLIVILVSQRLQAWIGGASLRTAIKVYLLFYMLMAVVSLFFTTRLTFAGNRFPDVYGNGATRRAYISAWHGGPVNTTDAMVVRRYGMRDP